MKKILELIKKYNIHILMVLLVFTTFRSCGKSTTIKKLEKSLTTHQEYSLNKVDSLSSVLLEKQKKIDSFPETLRLEKMNVHMYYDNWVTSKDRGNQLMELHQVIKNNINQLQK